MALLVVVESADDPTFLPITLTLLFMTPQHDTVTQFVFVSDGVLFMQEKKRYVRELISVMQLKFEAPHFL